MPKTKQITVENFFNREYINDNRVAIMAVLKIREGDRIPNKQTIEVASSANLKHAQLIRDILNAELQKSDGINVKSYIF